MKLSSYTDMIIPKTTCIIRITVHLVYCLVECVFRGFFAREIFTALIKPITFECFWYIYTERLQFNRIPNIFYFIFIFFFFFLFFFVFFFFFFFFFFTLYVVLFLLEIVRSSKVAYTCHEFFSCEYFSACRIGSVLSCM